MTLVLLEASLDYVVDYLESNMDTKVDNLNTRYSDTLPYMQEYYRGEVPLRLPELPCIAARGSGFTPGMQGKTNLEVVHNIDLFIMVGHDDTERRWRMICRYGLGVIELLRVAQSSTYFTRLGGATVLTNTVDAPTFLQGLIIPLAVHSKETY